MSEQIEWHPLSGEDRIWLRHSVPKGEGQWVTSPDCVLGWAVRVPAAIGQPLRVVYAMSSGRVIGPDLIFETTMDGHGQDELSEWWAWRD